MIPLWIYFLLGLVTAALCHIFTPLCARLSGPLGLVDVPDDRKLHKSPMPLTGGIAIFSSFNIIVLGGLVAGIILSDMGLLGKYVAYFSSFRMGRVITVLPRLFVVLAVGLGFFLVGIIDDKRAISARNRLLAEAGLATCLVIGGLRFDLGFLPDAVAVIITVVWVVGISNAFNLLDGLDGLAGGIAAICSCILTVVLIRGNQPLVAMFAVTLAGGAVGFLRHNFFPARIYMGSAGSLFLGYAVAVSVVLAAFVIEGESAAFPILMPAVLLAVPLYDTISVVLVRLKEGRPVFKGDRSHTHHRLLGAGFSERGTVLFMWLLTFMTGISSVLLLTADFWTSVLLFAQVCLAFALIMVVKHVRTRPPNGTGAQPPEVLRED